MIYIEWVSAVMLVVGMWLYPRRGMTDAGALVTAIGCAGFTLVSLKAGVYGIAVLNAALVIVNGYNLHKEWKREFG